MGREKYSNITNIPKYSNNKYSNKYYELDVYDSVYASKPS